MRERQPPSLLEGEAEVVRLLLHRVERVEIVRLVPRPAYMRPRRHDIGEMHEAFAAVADDGGLMVPGMAAGDDGAHASDDVSVAVDRFEHRAHGSENLLGMSICRAEPFVAWIVGDFELTALHENSRTWKRSLERAGITPAHDPSAMIEMQMRYDQMRDVARLHPQRLQMLREPSVAMIENLALDVAQPVADSRIDQDSVAALHYKRTRQIEADTVALVGRMVALP